MLMHGRPLVQDTPGATVGAVAQALHSLVLRAECSVMFQVPADFARLSLSACQGTVPCNGFPMTLFA